MLDLSRVDPDGSHNRSLHLLPYLWCHDIQYDRFTRINPRLCFGWVDSDVFTMHFASFLSQERFRTPSVFYRPTICCSTEAAWVALMPGAALHP
jgi:hypothetical protein